MKGGWAERGDAAPAPVCFGVHAVHDFDVSL